jgi:hypothetical protein
MRVSWRQEGDHRIQPNDLKTLRAPALAGNASHPNAITLKLFNPKKE